MWAGLEQLSGAVLVLLVLADVFFTVLYARIGSGILSVHLARLVWRLFRLACRSRGRRDVRILSFCGPAILVLLVLVWAFGLSLGSALIMHPELGAGIGATGGETPTDFLTALYAGGSSLSFVGASDLAPQTDAMRLLYLANSLFGMSVMSLTLMYLMQVYTALQQRNALGLRIHLLTAETGDAAELIAGLGVEGRFDGGYGILSDLGGDMANLKEAHHFYPVLFYFRFAEPYYSVSRAALVTLDTVALIKSALDDKQYAWLKESAPMIALWRMPMILVTTLEQSFLPGGRPEGEAPPDRAALERWRQRYFAATRRIRQAGIQTIADDQAGAEIYVALRARWDSDIARLAPLMAYRMEDIDPAGSEPDASDRRKDFRARLHSPR